MYLSGQWFRLDFMTKPELLAKAKECFDQELAAMGTIYKPLLPPETKPPLHLNVEEMGKYREQLKKFYLNVPIRFQ